MWLIQNNATGKQFAIGQINQTCNIYKSFQGRYFFSAERGDVANTKSLFKEYFMEMV